MPDPAETHAFFERVEADKREARRKAAALPFAEKIERALRLQEAQAALRAAVSRKVQETAAK
ncbi:MAG: hypothetical protein JST92_06980 [Deltaproteobacteria bacterium]|nr:hypothetical protein [Deltaproteobacteria bacterium]